MKHSSSARDLLMHVSHLPRLFRTLRHLRFGQMAWRGRRLLERQLSPLSVRRRGAAKRGLAERLDPACPRIALPERADGERGEGCVWRALEQGKLRLLNRAVQIGVPHPDWRLGPLVEDRLWIVTLHYHAWAYALARESNAAGADGERAWRLFRSSLEDWMARCAPERPEARDLAWNAFAVATRIGWWVRSFQAIASHHWASNETFQRAFMSSLYAQARFLHAHLEWDLRGNHLLRDALGLAWAGRFFQGREAEQWRRTAAKLVDTQLDEQILADGAHFELSPMYHAQVMEDLAALGRLLDEQRLIEKLRAAWARMADYLGWLRFPDGGIPLLNDAARGTGAGPEALLRWGRREGWLAATAHPRGGRGGRYFPDAGVVVWHGAPWSVFFDVGAVGPDGQPGHAHADTLNLVCAFRGQRLFVDPGTYAYDAGERRSYDRSTRAHNTVCVEGADSSEVWAVFRVGRRARPQAVRVHLDGGGFTAAARHDGYAHLPGRPCHQRTVRGRDGGRLKVRDRIEGQGEHLAEGGWLLHPGWSTREVPKGWELRRNGRRVRVFLQGPPGLQRFTEERAYHPRFHVECKTSRLGWRYSGPLPVEVRAVFAEC